MKTNKIFSSLVQIVLLLGFLFVSGNTAYAGSKMESHSGPEFVQNTSEDIKLSFEKKISDQCRNSCAVSSRPCFAKVWRGHKEARNGIRTQNWTRVCKMENFVCEKKCARDGGKISN